jgi:hypothetical protein
MVRLTAALIASVFLVTVSASAIKGPRLPSTAKKLTTEEIIRLYDGHTISFNNFTLNKPLTGAFTINYKAKAISGSYTFGTEKGTFKGTLRISGDNYCYKVRKGKEVCGAVYKDGQNIYEVNSMGKVTSQNQVVR